MSDILFRDVPDEVLAAIDADGSRVGLSRTEYLRRTLAQDAARTAGPAMTVVDLTSFQSDFGDLADEDVMREAWG